MYFERCKTILEDLEATELELGSLGAAPRGTLRISCPSWFDGQRVADLLAVVDHSRDVGTRPARSLGGVS